LSKGRAANSASGVSIFQGIISTWNQNGLSFTCLPSSTDLVLMTPPPVWWLNVFQFCESGRSLLKKTHFTIFKNIFSELFLKNVSQILHHLWQRKAAGLWGGIFSTWSQKGDLSGRLYLADLTHDGTIELESKGSWFQAQESLVQIPRNQFGLIWSNLNPWVGP
jgi:hypothetical protein